MSDVVCRMSHSLSLVHIRLVLNLAINLLVLVTSWTCTISIAAQAGQWKQATLTYGIRSRQGPKGQITWPKWSEINGSAKIGRHKWSDKKHMRVGFVRNIKFSIFVESSRNVCGWWILPQLLRFWKHVLETFHWINMKQINQVGALSHLCTRRALISLSLLGIQSPIILSPVWPTSFACGCET